MRNKIDRFHAALAGFVLTIVIATSGLSPAYADDTDIYTQQPPANPAKPIVVLTLDLNLDVTDIVCSNVLADPNTLTGSLVDKTACRLLQDAAVLPVLENTLGLSVGSLLDLVLGENSLVGGLLGVVGGLTGATLGGLSSALEPIVGSDSIVGNAVSITQLDVVRLLLFRILHQLVGVNLAIMVSHADTCEPEQFAIPRRNTTGCSNGGYFLLEPTELLEENINATLDDVLARMANAELNVASLGQTSNQPDLTPPFQGKELYYELYRYFTGKEIYNATLNDDDFLILPDPDTPSPNYTSPLDNTTCQDIHVINIMLTDSQADDDSDADILADFSGIAGTNPDDGGFTFDDMIQYFDKTGFQHNGVDYKVKSSFLLNGVGPGGLGGLLGNATGTLANLPIGLNPIGLPFVTKENFQPVNPASVSFGGPQPVFNRSDATQAGTSIYQGMFKPAGQAVWRGNLKKLKFSETNGELLIVDARGLPAIGPDGNIRPEALTFWTDPNALPETVEGEVEDRDGKSTDLGGAGMFLIPPRTVPTETNSNNARGSGSDLGSPAGPRVFYQRANSNNSNFNIAPLNLDNATVEDADPVLAGDAVDAGALIAFARGYDVPNNYRDNDGFLSFLGGVVSALGDIVFGLLDLVGGVLCGLLGIGCPTPPPAEIPGPRQWVMGDVLHSDPLPVSYADDDVRIFTGTNLGFMHQFRDEALAGEAKSFAGQEVWRVAPRAMLANFDEWQTNQAAVENRPYGVDGAPVAWVKDLDGAVNASDGDHVYLYFGLRRGGKGYYALDVTNPDAAPSGLWSITSQQADFAELGLTFSTPRLGRIRTADANGNSTIRTVLVFGGGYNGGNNGAGTRYGKDAEKGSDEVIGSNDEIGNALFIVDAATGELVWKARKGGAALATTANGKPVWEHPEFDDGIASDITALDTTGDGFLDRLYVGDTGGRIWRADIGSASIADWKAAPIADLGRHNSSTVADDRRFFERPDVVRVTHGGTGYFALIIGSGNRADPLNRNTDNQLYVLKDSGLLDATASAEPITQAGLVDFSNNCANPNSCLSLLNPEQVASGWRINLGAVSGREGEKALSSPTTIAGQVLFTSFVPPDVHLSACTPQEGVGRQYAVDLLTARGVNELFALDGESSDNPNNARSTQMAATGIPTGVRYIRPKTFLGGDFSLMNVAHRNTWRTYWRERDGEH